MTLRTVVMVTLLFLSTLAGSVGATPTALGGPVILGDDDPTAFPDSYVVVYRDTHKDTARVDLAATPGVTVRHRYSGALDGFAGTMDRATALRIAADPAVAFVERDRVVTPTAVQTPVPSWGLDRVDQASLPLNNSYTWINNASEVRVYVLDSGISVGHPAFGGRAVWGVNTTADGINTDNTGHGTHLAGIVGSLPYGVSKQVRLVAVKIISGVIPGSLGDAIAGMNWVTANHVKPAVALFGATTSASVALDTAIQNSIAAGVPYAVSAGNSNANACSLSPSRVPAALTIGAIRADNQRTSWSNFGPCLDAFAPGDAIRSTWISGGVADVAGTSQAAAFAAGIAAQYLGDQNNPLNGVTAALINASTVGLIPNAGAGSPNRILRTIW